MNRVPSGPATQRGPTKPAARPQTDPLTATRQVTIVLNLARFFYERWTRRKFEVVNLDVGVQMLATRMEVRGYEMHGLQNGKAVPTVREALTVGVEGKILTLKGNLCIPDFGICSQVRPLVREHFTREEREALEEEMELVCEKLFPA